MKRLHYYIAWSLLHAALGIGLAGMALERGNIKLRKFAMRVGGVDENQAERDRNAEWKKRYAEIKATPPDKYTIDLVTWKGDDGSPVEELLEMSPDQFAALKYTASAKHVTVESLLGEAVRKAVAV